MTTHVLAAFASGNGSDFQSIIDHIKLNTLQSVKIGILITNNSKAYAIERAQRERIPTLFIKGLSGKKFLSPEAKETEREAFDREAVKALKDHKVDVVALAGFMQVLSPYFIEEYQWRIMNIHPAKNLQKFGGPGMYGHHVHDAVLKAGEKESGCTIHYVTNDVDGGPIILQHTVPVKPNDTPDMLSQRILIYEHRVYAKAIQLHIDGRVKIEGGTVKVDCSGEWDKMWEAREKAYVQFQTEELLKQGKRIEDLL